MFKHILRALHSEPRSKQSPVPRTTLRCERLEDRDVPAIVGFQVDTLDDTHFDHMSVNIWGDVRVLDANNNTSLRAVVEFANMSPQNGDWSTNHYNVDLTALAGQTITLKPNLNPNDDFQTLKLSTNFNFLVTTGNVTIERPTTAGTPNYNHFDVDAGKECHWIGITLFNGKSTADGGSIYNNGTVQFVNCTFLGNSTDSSGGAIVTRSGATTTVDSCDFLYNSANSATEGGGAIAALPGSAVTSITNCTLTENEAVANGGAVWAQEAANLSIDGSAITWNRATGALSSLGGCVYVEATTSATINQTDITNNTAGWRGGGLYVLDCNLTMTYGQLSDNTADGNGGGFYIDADTKTVTMNTVNVTQNTSTNGRGGGGYVKAGTLDGSLSALTGNTNALGSPGIREAIGAFVTITVPSAPGQQIDRDQP